jgi:putative endonuclease
MNVSERSKNFGKWGEKVAAWYLELNGYSIIKRHYTNRFGEIDIIAEDKDQTVFVEVKTRSSERLGTPEQGFTLFKSKKIQRTIFAYISENNIENFRIDMIAVVCGFYVDKVTIRHHKSVSDIF